ncbi:MAG: ABC transporter permease [Candidatus Magasanikbacteria bacterium]|nr:ABC transporter permease [Candidatus Magasanikbacteria bacterium]
MNYTQILENISGALLIMTRNKIRSALTMLGIVIGVMAVVVIMSVGAGAQGLILNQIKSLGSNLVGVLPGKSDDKGPPAAVFGIVVTTLTSSDAEALGSGLVPHLTAVTAYVRGIATVFANNNQTDATFVGTMGSYPAVEDITITTGRFFSADEDRSLARVAVLGSAVAEDLFAGENPLGRQIKIKRVNFTVIGVVAERGTSGFQNQDSQIFVPLQTAQKLLLGINYVNFIRAKIDSGENVAGSLDAIATVLRERHRVTDPENDDFSVRSTNQGLEVLTSVTNVLRFFLAAIAALALLVGGLGIMNIMLAAVEERTREIGLRQALGATRQSILWQFLIETSTITLVGGIIGIILGIFISWLIAYIARFLGYSWDLVITFSSIILAAVVSIAIGLIFGLSPAVRASRLNPIDALRYE